MCVTMRYVVCYEDVDRYVWIDVDVAQQGSLGAENGLLGRGGAGMPRYVFVYGYIWDCGTVTLFGCVTV